MEREAGSLSVVRLGTEQFQLHVDWLAEVLGVENPDLPLHPGWIVIVFRPLAVVFIAKLVNGTFSIASREARIIFKHLVLAGRPKIYAASTVHCFNETPQEVLDIPGRRSRARGLSS